MGARVAAACLSVVLLAVSGWGWHLGQVAQAAVNRTDAIPGSGRQSGAMNVLLVGSDSRADLTPEQRRLLNAGQDAGMNTDTMIMVHVPADGSQASFVSFPRDSYVDIPGHGKDKLNAAFADGYTSAGSGQPESQRRAAGAQLLIQTIDQLAGVQIDHYAEIDLLGFFNLSNVVGGVEVNLCKPVDDHYSGAKFPAGVQTISGADALRFVRQRHGLPRGDFDRIVRQQVFIGGVLRKMLSQNVMLDLGKQQQLVQAVASSLTVDKSLDLMRFAQQMQTVTAGKLRFHTIPTLGTGRDPQGRSIVRLDDPERVHAFFADLTADSKPPAGAPSAAPPATTTTTRVAPSAVQVAVLNGSGIPGRAAAAKASLTAAGFTVASTGNADASTYATTEIRYAAGDEALARTVAGAVAGAEEKQVDGIPRGSVQLVLGADYSVTGRTAASPTSAAHSSTPAASGQTSSTDAKARTAADTSCIN